MPGSMRARGTGATERGRGQSLVEFTVVLPVLLFVVLIALDFGRAFSGWVVLQNAARIAANYAGLYPNGWRDSDPTIQAEYEVLIERDLATANCEAPETPPEPVFTDGPDIFVAGGNPDTQYDVGDRVRVQLTCEFRPLTPIITAITGSVIRLGAGSEFKIRAGAITGLPNATQIPPPGAATPAPTALTCVNPVASFSGTPTSGTGGSLLVAFTGLSSAPAGCVITSWSWSFGDGQSSTQRNPIHLYTKTNGNANQQRFDVTLTVQLTTGQSDVELKRNYVTVYQ